MSADAPHLAPSAEGALVRKIEEVRAERDGLEGPGTSTAIASLHRLEATLLGELRALRASAPPPRDPREDLSDAELLAEIVAAVADLSDADLDAIEAAVARRRTGRLGAAP